MAGHHRENALSEPEGESKGQICAADLYLCYKELRSLKVQSEIPVKFARRRSCTTQGVPYVYILRCAVVRFMWGKPLTSHSG
jgi:hypothetical protein